MMTPIQISYAKFSKLTIGNINFAAGGVYKDFISFWEAHGYEFTGFIGEIYKLFPFPDSHAATGF